MQQIHDFPLREIKFARTRLSLADALIVRMRDKSLSKITVDVLCRDAEISRGTFFRYFPRKVDLVFYILKLWEIEIIWDAVNSDDKLEGLEAIEYIFRRLAATIEKHPHLYSEIIALRAFEPQEFERMDNNISVSISEVERIIRYPDFEGIEFVPEGGFPEFFRKNLKIAVEKGELPHKINTDEINLSLSCICYGVPLMTTNKTLTNLINAYIRQIRWLWAGLTATEN
jgi:AcrR family transcriptional regulator